MKHNTRILLVTISLIILEVCTSKPSAAQAPGNWNAGPLYIGDVDTVAVFYINCACRTFAPYCDYYISPQPNSFGVYVWQYGPTNDLEGILLYYPMDTVTRYDTVNIELVSTPYPPNCYGGFDSLVFVASAHGSLDTIFRLRPTYQELLVKEQDSIHSWRQWFIVTLDNNTNDQYLAKNFLLKDDSITYDTHFYFKGQEIDSLLLAPHERHDTIEVEVTYPFGPIDTSFTRHTYLQATVFHNGASDNYRGLVDLNFSPVHNRFLFRSQRKSASLTQEVGTTGTVIDTVYMGATTLSHYYSADSTIFRCQDTKLDDTTYLLTISFTPPISGNFHEYVKLFCDHPDFFGTPRLDSLAIEMTAIATDKTDTGYWAPTASTGDSASYHVSVFEDGTVYASSGRRLLRSPDHGDSWQEVPTRDSICNRFVVDRARTIIRDGGDGAVHCSSDEGLTWYTQDSGMTYWIDYGGPPYDTYPMFVTTITLNDSGQVYVTAIGYNTEIVPNAGGAIYTLIAGVYTSSDHGKHWVDAGADYSYGQYGTDPPQSDQGYGLYFAIDSAQHLLVSSLDQIVSTGRSLPDTIKSIAIGAFGECYVGTITHGMYRSWDGGHTWEHLSLVLPDIRSIAVTPNSEIFFSSWGNGVYHTTDFGNTWKPVNGALTTNHVNEIVATPGQPIYLATDNAWVWKSTQIVGTNSSVKRESASGVSIRSYPNPTSLTSNIVYSLDHETNVQITLCDVMGRVVRSRNEGMQSEGTHSSSLRVNGLPPGIYTLALETDSALQTVKVVVVSQ